jgi:hypothetical protein
LIALKEHYLQISLSKDERDFVDGLTKLRLASYSTVQGEEDVQKNQLHAWRKVQCQLMALTHYFTAAFSKYSG